jgi:DNA helicase HerA-like ATPase
MFVIAGKRGYGKTTVAKTIISPLKRVAIWDPMHDYVNSYHPQTGSIDEFDMWMRSLWYQGNIFILVDEADIVMPEKKELSIYANKIVNLGRHRNIGMGVITRRIARLNKTVVSQCEVLISFHQFIPNDIKYLNEFLPNAKSLIGLKKFEYKTYQL